MRSDQNNSVVSIVTTVGCYKIKINKASLSK